MSHAVDLASYVAILRRGGVVACPTETLIGLLADATSVAAVEKVVAAKRRGAGEPIAVIAPDLAGASSVLAELPEAARQLAAAHWPGPLTIVARARQGLPPALVRDGKIGVRVPGPSPALDLCRAFGGALTATSANLSGEAPARTSDEARAALGDAVDAYVPGSAPGGPPSTVIDVTETPFRLVRAGAIRITEAKPNPEER
jgi:L-threonylcarbamoyladenylate synthase